MPEPYLAVMAAEWILLIRSAAVTAAFETGTGAEAVGQDLAALFGGAPATAWIRLEGGAPALGVSRVLGLVDLAPEAFAPLPAPLTSETAMFDAVTLAPIEGAHALRLRLDRFVDPQGSWSTS